jgi:hypothetical protein
LARNGQGILLGLAIFVAGVTSGWVARNRSIHRERERAQVEEPESAGESPPPAATAPDPRPTHDDQLRQLLTDPKAHALAARVRNASNVGGQCEVEVDTNISWFRVACGSDTPSVGDTFDLFGRVSPDGQIDGAPTLLRPAWLEPVGTIARLRGN